MTKFYDTDSETRWWFGITGRVVLGLLAFMVFAVVIGLGSLGWRYLFAGPSGQVQKREIIQSGTNQLGQQQRFEQLFADVKAYDVQISQTADALAATPDDSRLPTVLLGLKNQCVDATAQYDALARTERAEAFRAADLPPKIDVTAPATDCKETHR